MNSTVKQTIPILALAALVAACDPGAATNHDPADLVNVGSKEAPLYVSSSKVWSKLRIRVCWENSGHATEKAWMRDAIEQSWERHAATAPVRRGR